MSNNIVRALQAQAPLKLAPDTQFIQIRLDQAELAATPQIAALQTAVAAKQNTLGVGVVQGGHPLLEGGAIKAIKATAPVRVTSTDTHVDVGMDDSYFGAITAIADEAASKQAQLSAGSAPVFHEKLLEGTKIKSLTPGAGVDQSSTGELVTVAVSPNLAVSTLTAPASAPLSVVGGLQVSGLSQLAGLEASGLVAEQVVWVTGTTGSPNSIMFPGSLTLGKWRVRGTETGRFVLERFDDDGTLATNAWLPVTAFTHDANTNASGLESAAVRVDTISPFSTAVGSEVTCDGNMTVNGRLACGGVNVGNGSVVVPSNLTVGGVSFASLQFTAVEPLRKVVNLQTGAVELRVDAPFWVCGIFDGTDLTKLADTGRHPFTVTRAPGTTVGVFRVSWSTPHPLGINYIVHVTGEFGVAMVRRRIDGPNTSTSFDCFCRDPGSMATNVNRIIHFSVVA